jgi:uncharacterized protein
MSTPAPSNLSPTSLDVRTFAQAGEALSGIDPLSKYERLAQDLHGLAGDWDDKAVQWSARGEIITPAGGHAQRWLHLQVNTHLPMTCQRCLAQVLIPVAIDNSFRFVADEATALAEDDTAEEDLLVISKQFNLRDLIEDELLMALPIVPKHDVCPGEVKLASTDEDFKAALTQKPNAFAALGSLKKPG